MPEFAAMLRPDPLPDGEDPEERLILCGIGWERYLALDKALGDDRPGPRFYYLDGDLEIMTTSNEHERIKKWIGSFMDIFFRHAEIDIMPRGQATMRDALKQAGAEPDKSWCIGEEREFPDLVLEIALTTGLRKLEIYRRFEVPEVWFWRKGRIEVFVLRDDRSGYDPSSTSHLLPQLEIPLLEKCVAIRNWRQACQRFEEGLP
jgi:Uma2 family endonuclease